MLLLPGSVFPKISLVFPQSAAMGLVGQMAKRQCRSLDTRKLSIGTCNEMNKEL